jgi:hypothetical protein
MAKHHVIAGIGNDLSGLPLSIHGPKSSLPTITAATRAEEVSICRYQLGELGLRAVMLNAEAILSLKSVRQSAINTLGRESALKEWFVRGIGREGRGIKLPAVMGLGIAKGVPRPDENSFEFYLLNVRKVQGSGGFGQHILSKLHEGLTLPSQRGFPAL